MTYVRQWAETAKNPKRRNIFRWMNGPGGKSTGSFIAPKTRLRYKGGWHDRSNKQRAWRLAGNTTDDHIFYCDILNPTRPDCFGFIATVEEPSQYPQYPTTNGIPLTPHVLQTPDPNSCETPRNPSKLTPQRSYLFAILCGNNRGN